MNHCSEDCSILRGVEKQRDATGKQLDAAGNLAEAVEDFLTMRCDKLWLAKAVEAYIETTDTELDPEVRAWIDAATPEREVAIAQ